MLAEMGIKHVDFAKIDVEGFEPHVLKGLRKILESSRPVVFFEWSAQRADILGQQTVSQLFPSSYAFFRFVPYRPLLGLFNRPGFDVQRCSDDQFHRPVECNFIAVPSESPLLPPLIKMGDQSRSR